MRVLPPSEKDHRFRATERDGEVILVGGRRNAYLWIGPAEASSQKDVYTVSGPVGLRALARAILREIPCQKPRPR